MFAIGVGEAEEDELIEIASSPAVDYVYNVADYVAISSIKDSLVQNVCEQSEGIYRGKLFMLTKNLAQIFFKESTL